jgi:predicted transposase YdaD
MRSGGVGGSCPPMADNPLHQPNDKLFRATFSVTENAAAFLSATLPPDLIPKIDWSGLALRPGTFVDSHFSSSQSDLLFSAPLAGREAFIYILFEHQSSPDRWLALRLLRYMVRIWETCAADRPAPATLPVILPVVLAQNPQPWNLAPRFSPLIDLAESDPSLWLPFVPDFRFTLLQLADFPFDALPGTPSGVVVLRVLKAERLGRLLDPMVWDEALLTAVPTELFHLIVRYILAADVDTHAFMHTLSCIQNPATRSTAMTLADRLRQEGLLKGRQEGHQEGRQEGRQEALQEAVLNVLKTRFDRVPDGLRDAILAADEEKLRLLHSAAIRCRSLEAFAEHL